MASKATEAVVSGPRMILPEEVKQHSAKNGDKTFWAVIDNYVVDATAFLDTHPGGLKNYLVLIMLILEQQVNLLILVFLKGIKDLGTLVAMLATSPGSTIRYSIISHISRDFYINFSKSDSFHIRYTIKSHISREYYINF